jgi:flagellar hook-associated protein 2
MAGIQLSGLVSGLDTQSIISQLMAVERHPRTGITLQQSATTKRQSLLQDLGAKMTTLKSAVDALSSAATWADTQSVSSTDETKVAVSRTSGAPPGGYDVAINQLASAERRTYGYTPPATAGALQILNSDGTQRSSINLAAGATLDDAVAAINSDATANVFAVNVSNSLVLAAKTTGVSSGFSAQGMGVGTQTQLVAGQDAQFTIGATSYTRSSNVVTDALPGVQLTLKGKTATGATVGVTVGGPGPDKDAVVGKVKAFVDAYNALVTTARADLSEKTVPKATTAADAQKGTLFGDTGLSAMLSALRTSVGAAIPGLTGLKSLNDIGVSTGAANTGATINGDAVAGLLTVDETKLRSALDSNPLGVRKLLGGTPNVTGFAQSFGAVVAPFQGTGGVLDQRVTEVGKDLTRIKDKLDAFDARMDTRQAYYQKQFTALEQALQKSQTVGNSLASYVAPKTQ